MSFQIFKMNPLKRWFKFILYLYITPAIPCMKGHVCLNLRSMELKDDLIKIKAAIRKEVTNRLYVDIIRNNLDNKGIPWVGVGSTL